MAMMVIVGLLASCRSQPVPEPMASRRHVLLLTVDTLRADYLSANGYLLPTTPFIDEIMAGGTTFRGALTTVPRTTPALASLFTGTYPHTHGARNLVDSVRPDAVSLAELLRRRGYATVAVVSNHILTRARGLDRGFDVYDFGDDARAAEGTTRAALEQIGRQDPSTPLFLWVHYIDPHVPYHPPADLARAFSADYQGPYALYFGAHHGGIGDQAYPDDLGKAGAVFRNRLPDNVNAHIRRLYAAEVRSTDDQVAVLVTRLRAALGPDWLIVFSADHGESLGENNYFYDHGDYVSNAELRVPLTFSFATSDPLYGRRSVDAWVSLVDVFPTLVDLLNLALPADIPYRLEGRSLLRFMRGDTLPAQAVFAESGEAFFPALLDRGVRCDDAGRLRTVFSGANKLIWTPGQNPAAEYELYDLEADPEEQRNLYQPGIAGSPADELKALLAAWMAREPQAGASQAASEADRERLRALGYVN